MTVKQARFNRLKADALASAQWRGHSMGQWRDTARDKAECFCLHCGRGVWVDLNPAPNGIDVAGEAVAMGCNRMRV